MNGLDCCGLRLPVGHHDVLCHLREGCQNRGSYIWETSILGKEQMLWKGKHEGYKACLRSLRKGDAMNKQAFLTELRKKMCSIERRQSRLLAMTQMPDDDYRDAVLERHKMLEEKESKVIVEDVTGSHDHGKREPNTAFQSSLHQISEELKQLEICMSSIDAS